MLRFMAYSLVLLVMTSVLRAQPPAILSSFDSLDGWVATPSDGVEVTIRSESPPGADGGALRIDYNFAKGSGFCVIRKAFPMSLPENYEFQMRIRGEGLPNNFEFKLIDGSIRGADATASGDDVWWLNRRAYTFPREWQTLRVPKRRMSFAWGPSGGTEIRTLGAIEFAIAAASGGKGTLWIDSLSYRPLPPLKPYTGTPIGSASSRMCELHTPDNLFDPDPTTAWQSDAADAAPTFTVDFGESRQFGGLVLEWEQGHAPKGMRVELSEDAATWILASVAADLSPDRAFVPLRDAQARYVRLSLVPVSAGSPVGIQTLTVKDADFSDTANGFFKQVAKEFPRGFFPRYYSGEQSFWTVLGLPGDAAEAAINEEGAVELAKGQCTVEPFLSIDGQTLSWAESQTSQRLANEYIPVPSVERIHDRAKLTVTAFVDGAAGDGCLHVCYEVTPTTAAPVSGSILLAVRPFQILPPWHELNLEGGVTPIAVLSRDGDDLLVNGSRRIATHLKPARISAAPFDTAPTIAVTALPDMHPGQEVRDPGGVASAVIEYPFNLEPGKAARFWISAPFKGSVRPARLDFKGRDPDAVLRELAGKTAGVWNGLLSKTRFQVPPEAQEYVNAYQAQLAYILISAAGPALQPGTRTYDRSWIRDGASIVQALLEAGHTQPVRAFIDWFAGYQYENGKVPCVVDGRGPDPVPEHDSHGQYIHAVVMYYHFTRDAEFVKRHMPGITRAVEYIEAIRAQRMTDEFKSGGASRQEPGKAPVPARAFYGLVPESISHEGYSAKPMHSYWDTFWTLRGLKDAVEAARITGDSTLAEQWKVLSADFAVTLASSIAEAQAAHSIDFIPGCVELGDFDPTSTAIGIWPCQIDGIFPPSAVNRTFARAYSNFAKRRDDPAFAWDAYTPYEFRMVPAFLCLGEKDKALSLMEWYMRDRRPRGWNHWAEVVWKDPRAPKFVGDMPHAWVGAEYMHAWRNMFVFERERDDALVVLAGVPAYWFRKDIKGPIGAGPLPTWYGPLTLGVNHNLGLYTINMQGDLIIPPGGIIVKTPSIRPIRLATVNGHPAEINADGEIVVRELPARLQVTQFEK